MIRIRPKAVYYRCHQRRVRARPLTAGLVQKIDILEAALTVVTADGIAGVAVVVIGRLQAETPCFASTEKPE
jgi:hypothetical protein